MLVIFRCRHASKSSDQTIAFLLLCRDMVRRITQTGTLADFGTTRSDQE
jgi:hypothetical protein